MQVTAQLALRGGKKRGAAVRYAASMSRFLCARAARNSFLAKLALIMPVSTDTDAATVLAVRIFSLACLLRDAHCNLTAQSIWAKAYGTTSTPTCSCCS